MHWTNISIINITSILDPNTIMDQSQNLFADSLKARAMNNW